MDTNTNALIKDVAFNIIGITTIWSLLNNPHLANINYINNNYVQNNLGLCKTILGLSLSGYFLAKYY
jgi:hypothetical protein